MEASYNRAAGVQERKFSHARAATLTGALDVTLLNGKTAFRQAWGKTHRGVGRGGGIVDGCESAVGDGLIALLKSLTAVPDSTIGVPGYLAHIPQRWTLVVM